MDAQTHGFDLLYQIDRDSLLAALENLITDPVAMRLASLGLFIPLPEPAPLNTVQHGTFQLLSQPITTVELPAQPLEGETERIALLRVRFPTTLLQLDAVPAVLGVFDGVDGLPLTQSGELELELRLAFAAADSAGGASLMIESRATSLSLGSLPNLTGLTTIALESLVRAAITAAIQNALATLLPLGLNVPFAAPGLCGIGPRSLAVKILRGGEDTKPALGFFLTLMQSSSGNLEAADESTLAITPDTSGAFVLSNSLLKELVCCLFRQSPDISGLPEPTATDDDCCRWENVDNVRLAGEKVKIERLEICIRQNPNAQSTIELSVTASQSGTGWTAYAEMTTSLQLVRDGNALGVVQVEPSHRTWEDISPWVWLIVGLTAALGALAGALIGFFTAGWAGAGAGAWKGGVIGAAVGVALVGVTSFVLHAIGSLAGQAISGVLGALGASDTELLPEEIASTFGTISDIVEVDFDDLLVGGRVRPPNRNNVVREGSDIVLRLGDRIDLDRGVVQRANEQLHGFALEGDLYWRPDPPVVAMSMRSPSCPSTPSRLAFSPSRLASREGAWQWGGSIVPLRTARLVGMSNSFWSITETGLQTLSFPQSPFVIRGGTIVQSQTPYPVDARVFAVRTTAGRHAKCAAWRDAYQQLHLSYVTYNTSRPLWINSRWTVTRGPNVSTPPALHGAYQVARTGLLQASKIGFDWLPWPWTESTTYTWRWNDQVIAGSGTLPDGTTTFLVAGNNVRLQSAMGSRLQGVLQVEAEVFGRELVATVDLDEPGTERESLVAEVASTAVSPPSSAPSVEPPPNEQLPAPLSEQLPAAFARGMGIPLEKVRFR